MTRFESWSAERASEIIASHLGREGAMLPLLHDLQGVFGCVPQAAVPLVAEALNLTRAEVHGVVTFYHDFRREPPGRHVVKLCRAEACQAAGGDAVAAYAQSRFQTTFGGTSADRQVTLDAVYCLGLCACAPAAMIDGRPVGRLDRSRIDRMVAETRT
jgi:formate dehydrogenase subunit gamma